MDENAEVVEQAAEGATNAVAQASVVLEGAATQAQQQAVEWWGIIEPYILPILFALLILFFGRIVAKMLSKVITRLLRKSKLDDMLILFLSSFTYIILMVFVVLAALEKIGVKTTSFIAVLGAAGLAIGLAFKDSLSNFSSGLMLLIFRPFKVGDFVEAGGTAGIVEMITIFTTQMRTPDNKMIIVPNAKITTENITNFTARDTRRMDLVIGVSYGDNLQKVKDVLCGIVAADERILKDPAVTVGVLELADSSVNFAVRPWVKTSEYWNVYFDLMQKIKERLDEEGISIPFPQRDLHMISPDSPAA